MQEEIRQGQSFIAETILLPFKISLYCMAVTSALSTVCSHEMVSNKNLYYERIKVLISCCISIRINEIKTEFDEYLNVFP